MTKTLTLGTQNSDRTDIGMRRVVVTLGAEGSGGTDRIALFGALRRLLTAQKGACLFVVEPEDPKSVAALKTILEGHPRVHTIAAGTNAGIPHLFGRYHLLVTERADDAATAAALDVPTLLLKDAAESARAPRTGSIRRIGRNSEKLLAAANEILTPAPGAEENLGVPHFLIAFPPSGRNYTARPRYRS